MPSEGDFKIEAFAAAFFLFKYGIKSFIVNNEGKEIAKDKQEDA
jgi:hypothetical protein